MNPVDLETIETALVNPTISEEAAVSAIEALSALRRRDWSVRVLDAWADWWEGDSPAVERQADGQYVVTWHEDIDGIVEPRSVLRPTPDAARHAAALAVLPTLDAASQADLGECP